MDLKYVSLLLIVAQTTLNVLLMRFSKIYSEGDVYVFTVAIFDRSQIPFFNRCGYGRSPEGYYVSDFYLPRN
jgi:hypothetical protein